MITQSANTHAFTLLEMVVVLTLIGLIAAIAFPRLTLIYDRVELSLQKDDIASQLAILGFKAYQRGKNFTLQQAVQEADLILLPSGWQLTSTQVIEYSSIGVCQGGKAEFSSSLGKVQYQLTAPFCTPSTP